MEEINFYFNDSSKRSSKYSQDSHDSLTWEQNADSHLEDKNE